MPVIPGIVRAGVNLTGADHGATVSLIFDISEPGQGPRLHRHPYDEIWVVEEGTVTFQTGEERFQATAGDVVVVPPDAPHKFTADGPGRSKMVCIHASPRFRTEWLE